MPFYKKHTTAINKSMPRVKKKKKSKNRTTGSRRKPTTQVVTHAVQQKKRKDEMMIQAPHTKTVMCVRIDRHLCVVYVFVP